jgi:hypothetical protein
MPPVLAAAIVAAIPAAGATAFSIGATAFTYATVAAYAIVTAASVGVSLLLQGQQKREKQDPSQIHVKQALPSRVRGYGRHKLAGAMFLFERSGADLIQGIVHCEGPIDAIEQWWLNDKQTTIPSGTAGSATFVGIYPWALYVSVESHLGATTQTASAQLLSRFGAFWTSNHRGRGLAYSIIRYDLPPKPEKNFQLIYPNGAPGLRVVARLSTVYDPRTGLTAWSDNPALAIRDYLTHARGFAIPSSRMDDDLFAAFANVCDELIPLKAGGTEKRYRLGGTYDLTEERREVLKRLLATCDAELFPTPEGNVGIRGGKWEEPTVTISDEHILSYSDFGQANDKLDAFNRLKISYTSPAHDYQPTEGEAWDNLASQAQIGVLEQDFNLPMVQWFGQARRLAKIAMAKGNPRWKGTVVTNLAGLNALGERLITLQISELGLNETFLITHFEIGMDGPAPSSCIIGVTSLDESAYSWDAATEEGEAPPVPADTWVAAEPPDPEGITLSRVESLLDPGVYASRIRITADDPADDIEWQLTGRLRRQGEPDTAWITVDDRDETDPLGIAILTDILEPSVTYELQVAFRSPFGASQSAWSASQFFDLNLVFERITEAGDTRITEADETRVLENA